MPHIVPSSDGASVADNAFGRPRLVSSGQIRQFLLDTCRNQRHEIFDLVGECRDYLFAECQGHVQDACDLRIAATMPTKPLPRKTIRRALAAMGLLPVLTPPAAALEYRRAWMRAARLWMMSTVILRPDGHDGLCAVPYAQAYKGVRLDHFCMHYTTLTDGRGQVWADLRPLRREITHESLMKRLMELAGGKFSDRPALIVHHIPDGSVAVAASEYPKFRTLYVEEPLGLPCEGLLPAEGISATWVALVR